MVGEAGGPAADEAYRQIATEVARLRPDIGVEVAIRGDGRGGSRFGEAVLVPLSVSTGQPADLTNQRDGIRANHRALGVRLADAVGPDPALLRVVDQRLREALRLARVRELDALVLSTPGSSDPRTITAMARLARLWGARHHLPTHVAYAAVNPPSTGEAVRDFRRAGKRHVAVGSLFLAPGAGLDRAAELAWEAGALAVSPALGWHPELGRLILARYAVGALGLLDLPA